MNMKNELSLDEQITLFVEIIVDALLKDSGNDPDSTSVRSTAPLDQKKL